MSKVTVSKEIDGEVKEFEVETGPDNTAYLCSGEKLVSNPSDAKIHYPRDRTHIKSLIIGFVVISLIAFGAYAFIATNAG